MEKRQCHSVPYLQRLAVSVALLCIVLSTCSPSPTRACSRTGDPDVLVGVPADGDTDVPTDVVIYYLLAFSSPGNFELRDASGAEVAVSARPAGNFAVELAPAKLLRANARYTLTVTWSLKHEVTFETGAGPLATPPEPPRAVVQSYRLGVDSSTECGPPGSGSCVSVADDSAWLIYTRISALGNERESYTTRGSFQVNLASDPDLPCVDIRARALNGARSAPLRVCGTDGPVQNLTALFASPRLRCSAAGLAWCDESGHAGIAAGANGAPRGVEPLRCPATTPPRPPAPMLNDLSGAGSGVGPLTAPAAAGSAAGSLASASARRPSPAGAGCSVVQRTSQPVAGVWSFAVVVAGAALLRRHTRRGWSRT